MKDIAYILAIWAHVFTVCFWVGAMFFSDPDSTRFFSRLVERIGGVGWYAQAVLWTTGIYMLWYRGFTLEHLTSGEMLSTPLGQTGSLKILFVFGLIGLQIVYGHKPSKKAPFAYVILAFLVVGLSTMIVRPGALW